MEDVYVYNVPDQCSSIHDEIVSQQTIQNNEDSDGSAIGGDCLLIDLVRGYPHLYDKSSPNFKDCFMKDNSWEEIAKNMMWTPVECKNRWIRLRERFSKERREIEVESKSGSGSSNRQSFIFYENMKFLNNHVQRRRTVSNLSQIKPKKENIPPISNVITENSPTTSVTVKNKELFRPISQHSNTECTVNKKNTGNLEMINEIQSGTKQFQHKSPIFETSVERLERCSSGSSTSRESVERLERCSSGSSTSREYSTSTSSNIQHRDTELSTPKKIKKIELDNMEKTFISLSNTIENKIKSSSIQTSLDKSEKNSEDKFAELIVAELKNISEYERKEKKMKMLQILWN